MTGALQGRLAAVERAAGMTAAADAECQRRAREIVLAVREMRRRGPGGAESVPPLGEEDVRQYENTLARMRRARGLETPPGATLAEHDDAAQLDALLRLRQ